MSNSVAENCAQASRIISYVECACIQEYDARRKIEKQKNQSLSTFYLASLFVNEETFELVGTIQRGRN